jgi:pyruvate formate lyase activating enzyme
MIPTYNNSTADLDDIIRVINEYGIEEFEILPYHRYGENKFHVLNRPYALKDLEEPDAEETKSVASYIRERTNAKITVSV